MIVSARGDGGLQLIRDGQVEDLREAVKLLLDSYNNVITLVTGAFGAAAFIVTLQQNQKGHMSQRAVYIFLTGIGFLAAALIPALVGREALLTMLVHNAVDINLPMLTVSRWVSYCCIVIAVVLIAVFAMEAAFAPVEVPRAAEESHGRTQRNERAAGARPGNGVDRERT